MYITAIYNDSGGKWTLSKNILKKKKKNIPVLV